MSVPSMVHRSKATEGRLKVRSVESGDADDVSDAVKDDAEDDVLHRATATASTAAPPTDSRLSSAKELPDCKVRRNYTCSSCDFFTQNPRLFLYHLRDVHNERIKVYECPSCLYASKHFQKLLRHSKMVHGTSEGVSPGETTTRKSRKRAAPPPDTTPEEEESPREETTASSPPDDLLEDDGSLVDPEMIPEDSDRPVVFKCSVCAFTCRSRVQLGKHEREEHIKTKFFRCSKCTYVTHIKARYTKHVKYHSMPMIKCDLCDFRTPYKWNLDRHCKNHNGKGAFRCSACNFTADIKQSLTVHEMNHHVPPVGQAAGLGVGRRRNKVGASDATAAEEAAAASTQESNQVVQLQPEPAAQPGTSPKEDPPTPKSRPKIKITPKKTKSSSSATSSTNGVINDQKQGTLSDFVHPDDIVQHANGNVYIKNKCKLCNFKTAWDTEMAKHEKRFHSIEGTITEKPIKKTPRPVPNLIPIPSPAVLKISQQKLPVFKIGDVPQPKEPVMSQKDINDICSRSANSALKDFASLFGSEDVFKSPSTSKVPDLIPTSIFASVNRNRMDFKQKNASFFDRLKEKLESGTGCNLVCNLCGHESKCLTEQIKHQKLCGKEISKVPNIIPVHNISASRCQYCRQRCKSSADLYIHLQTCIDALKFHSEDFKQDDDTLSETENELKIDEDRQSVEEEFESKPHPMENKVFVWNDIMVPMDIEVDDSNYEYTEDKLDDNGSLDLSIRTHSPACSENSLIGQENNNSINTNNNLPLTSVQHSPVTPPEKIPTHGNDISVAQHKRVFKCPHCTFWASTASRFHVHIVGHLNKKPFECSLCSYRSNWRWDITKHIKLKSVRDQAHESAKVLMTDETGRRNYSKYNKYLTEIPLSSLTGSETSGGAGTRPRNQDKGSPSTSKTEKNNRSEYNNTLKSGNVRPPPPLKVADKHLLASVTQEKKKSGSDGKRTLFKCKRCNFRDASRDILLQHVKGHYEQAQLDQEQLFQQAMAAAQVTVTPTLLTSSIGATAGAGSSVGASAAAGGLGVVPQGSVLGTLFSSQDLSLRGTSPDNDERHCRLKHSGDIRVVSTKNGQEKIEIEEQLDEPEHSDVIQYGAFKCKACPYATDNHEEFQRHIPGHLTQLENSLKCSVCQFAVAQEDQLVEHLKLHGISEASDLIRSPTLNDSDGKKFKCVVCPYVTNSKSQYIYHKQFHKDRGARYTCSHCSYNVSKRHLLHQHLKVHGISMFPPKNDTIEGDEAIDKSIDERPSSSSATNSNQLSDVPLVWVSKNGKFSKMFKCRYCPHVNLRKVNITEHEKMHGNREKSPNTTKVNDVEHRCSECNYVCNNAGVLSSHSKVHQGFYGIIHCLVDFTKSDEEQIQELTKALGAAMEGIDTSEFLEVEMEEVDSSSEALLYFCADCPARFLKENEYNIHRKFHSSGLQYKCDFCSYAAENNSYLMSHVKVHAEQYQDRTKILKTFHGTSSNHSEPEVKQLTSANGQLIWGVQGTYKSELEQKNNILASFLSKPPKATFTVPISGTDLFQKKSEAQQLQTTELSISEEPRPGPGKSPDPQFGILMHGNPDFVYQTYIKNGRTKEKRYKCHKCPSAFEKREQYKIHLGLHGSKQRYNCNACDYSVKYYANFVQHLKKHKFNDDAQAAKKPLDVGEEIEEVTENMEVTNEGSPQECDDMPLKPSAADQEVLSVVQQTQRKINSTASPDEKKTHWCPHCPYVNGRKDALENHLKRHERISGIKSTYACQHCDYSVPQAHFLRDHTKLHFIPKKVNHTNGYMNCDNLTLTSSNVQASTVTNHNDDVKFNDTVEKEDGSGPSRGKKLREERFNNNKGEINKVINVQTGDLVVKKDFSDISVEKSN